MNNSSSAGNHLQEPYVRNRDNPYFDGLLRGDIIRNRSCRTLNFQGTNKSRSISRATSDVSNAKSEPFIQPNSEKSMDSPVQNSPSDVGVNLSEQPAFGRLSEVSEESPFAVSKFQSDAHDSTEQSTTKSSEADEGYQIVALQARPVSEKSYILNRRKQNLSNLPLPQSAATFYSGLSPQYEIKESWETAKRLNLYLKSRRDEVRAGVPGKFLHAVLGQDISDVGSVVSTIMYAFYLSETADCDQLCTVPVINAKRAYIDARAELKWLLDSCQIEESSLICIDEIDLSYYHLFGSLKLVLLNGDKLPTNQELAGILLDTGNLSAPHCTIKDKYMATLLINGAGHFGSNALYRLLKFKMFDVSDLKVVDILRKDFKRWTGVGKLENRGSRSVVSNIGMSSVGISIEQLLSHQDNSVEEIKYFQRSEKLRLLVIVSGYNDSQTKFKREILVAAETLDLMKALLLFLNSKATRLPLKVLSQPGLKDEMRVFELDKITSRKTIERLLEDFGGSSSKG